MFSGLGAELEKLCKTAKHEVVLVAPFIKYKTLSRLLEIVDDDVKTKCITRWRPDEIIMGVSDIEIWLLLRDRPNASLELRADLHAKYYRADKRCLVGSANLTATALGWSPKPNLELLINTSLNELDDFESNLLSGCVTVDDSLYKHMKFVVDNTTISRSIEIQSSLDEVIATYADEIHIVPPDAWIPTLRHPEKLYTAYMGQFDKLGVGSKIAAMSDLQTLDIPPRLNEADFNAYIGFLLLQKPIIQRIDHYVTRPQRFGAVRDLLSKQKCAMTKAFDPTMAWQTTMRWMVYFLDSRYEVKKYRHSEIICRSV